MSFIRAFVKLYLNKTIFFLCKLKNIQSFEVRFYYVINFSGIEIAYLYLKEGDFILLYEVSFAFN